MNRETACALLGLAEGDSFDSSAINSAYKKAMMINHPDRYASNDALRAHAEEQCKLINVARDVLLQGFDYESAFSDSRQNARATRRQEPACHAARSGAWWSLEDCEKYYLSVLGQALRGGSVDSAIANMDDEERRRFFAGHYANIARSLEDEFGKTSLEAKLAAEQRPSVRKQLSNPDAREGARRIAFCSWTCLRRLLSITRSANIEQKLYYESALHLLEDHFEFKVTSHSRGGGSRQGEQPPTGAPASAASSSGGCLIPTVALVLLLLVASVFSGTASSPSSSHSDSGSVPAVSRGDVVMFGNYEWRVLGTSGGNALLITRDSIDARRFDPATNSWADSELRAYLNGDFLAGFSATEQAEIQTTVLGDVDTRDKVFLLSADEVGKYFNSAEDCYAAFSDTTPDSSDALADYNADVERWWWLRTPGANGVGESLAGSGGVMEPAEDNVAMAVYGVRPAVWVDMSCL